MMLGAAPPLPTCTRVIETSRLGPSPRPCVTKDLQTALNGQGVVLGILPFVEEDISEGRLLRPFDLAVDPVQAYYLIYAKQRLEKPAVRTVCDWLLSQIS